ncbi:hypothetical protein JRO89_XS12G0164900 [Xanthoceras sorbifolium]|uniref:Uncharacterized protein n=1 Tax=Xanthoceras sorbifolium TaxID=99658 RepID=A0ABQ8HCV2_9ROSI|nr:hypothetical protein JRO89_XS12G0164900 [Xanthoceras sorbifolium]
MELNYGPSFRIKSLYARYERYFGILNGYLAVLFRLFSSYIQTVAMHRNEWVENADRWVAGFLEMFEEGCHKMGTAIRDRIQERLRGQQSSDSMYLLQNGKNDDDDEDEDEEYYDEDDDDSDDEAEYYYDDEESYDEKESKEKK